MNDAADHTSGVERSVVLFLAVTIDGYIAKQNGSLDWLPGAEDETGATPNTEDFGYSALIDRVDTVIFGRRTFAQVQAMGHDPNPDKARYVFSRNPVDFEGVTGWSNSPQALIDELRSKPGKDIWLVGGANIADEFLRADLVDEITLTVFPLLLGSGIPLFMSGRPEAQFKLKNAESFVGGIVNLNYIRDRL